MGLSLWLMRRPVSGLEMRRHCGEVVTVVASDNLKRKCNHKLMRS
jgi:hypothetical protein